MKKRSKREDSRVNLWEEVDVAGLMNTIQESLTALGKKLDILLSRPQDRAPEGNKPFRNFDRNRQFGGGRSNDNFRERKLYRVICADCKKECEVPFNPTGDRPVYCKECFARRKDNKFSFKDTHFEHRSKDRDFTSGRHFDKKRGKKRTFGKKKK